MRPPLAVLGFCVALSATAAPPRSPVVVASKPFGESYVLAEMFAQLLDYKQTHGNFRVSRSQLADAELCQWVKRQRRLHSQGRMPADRRQRLDTIGFDWEAANGLGHCP